MFGKRPDGVRINNLSRMRAFMPFVSPRRNDANVLFTTEIEVDDALVFIDRFNEKRDEESQLTLFHLYLRALARVFHERPGVNRFVAGGRLWQRSHVAVTFAAKQSLEDGAPLKTIKRFFPEEESIGDLVDSITARLQKRRGGEVTRSDKEINLAMLLPVFLTRIVVWLLDRANHLHLLPKSVIDDDPLFCSVFVANLGSVGLDAGYHHLWEYGTCSHFAVLGRVHTRYDGKQVVNVRYNYDERVEDGLYAAKALSKIKDWIEKPESLL